MQIRNQRIARDRAGVRISATPRQINITPIASWYNAYDEELRCFYVGNEGETLET